MNNYLFGLLIALIVSVVGYSFYKAPKYEYSCINEKVYKRVIGEDFWMPLNSDCVVKSKE